VEARSRDPRGKPRRGKGYERIGRRDAGNTAPVAVRISRMLEPLESRPDGVSLITLWPRS